MSLCKYSQETWSSQVQAQLEAATVADQPRPQSDFEPLLIRFGSEVSSKNQIKSGSKSDRKQLKLIRQEKRAQRLSFWVRRPPGGVGVFHVKGWWPKTSCPPSKVCLPWVSIGVSLSVTGSLPFCCRGGYSGVEHLAVLFMCIFKKYHAGGNDRIHDLFGGA